MKAQPIRGKLSGLHSLALPRSKASLGLSRESGRIGTSVESKQSEVPIYRNEGVFSFVQLESKTMHCVVSTPS